tara:strand:+ start:231 stop:368 length:138 start_codon:yes stop_codon:yes gene_type:complete
MVISGSIPKEARPAVAVVAVVAVVLVVAIAVVERKCTFKEMHVEM